MWQACAGRLGACLSAAACAIALALAGSAHAISPLASTVSPRELLAYAGPDKPDFTLADVDGNPHHLKQHAGRIVLVHFFATWCEPCREELASLSRLTDLLGRERVIVLAVNVAEVPARVGRYFESVRVSFPVVLDLDRAVTKAWKVNGLPTTFVLDRDLKARHFVEGDIEWTKPETLAALEAVESAP